MTGGKAQICRHGTHIAYEEDAINYLSPGKGQGQFPEYPLRNETMKHPGCDKERVDE
jgi:hypothetical protein